MRGVEQEGDPPAGVQERAKTNDQTSRAGEDGDEREDPRDEKKTPKGRRRRRTGPKNQSTKRRL